MDRMMRSHGKIAVLALLSAASCTPAINFLDPHGPRYAGGDGVRIDSDGGALRIVSFNIAYGREAERAVGCLGAPPLRDADVVLLQEMHASAVELMARALRMSFVYYPSSVRPRQAEMGEAILSPWPIE